MNFVLPIRPSRPSKGPKTPIASRTTRTLQPPPESPRRRPSLATRSGITKRRSSVSTAFNAPTMSFFEAMFGDDFPGTFAHDDGRSCKSNKTIFDLPSEMLEIICRSLYNTDIKRLRLTCRELADTVELPIDRVFISPNRANLDCLNGILNHHRYCLRIREIIWDDAQLDEYPTIEQFRERLVSDQQKARAALEDHFSSFLLDGENRNAHHESITVEDCVDKDGQLTHIGKAILLGSDDKKSVDLIASHAATMSIEDSYALYQKLYQDEREIMKRAWDVAGLQRALGQLPNLRRITLTSEVWRPWTTLPAYSTPFYRALPAGFQKPSVWPWDQSSHPASVDTPGYDNATQHQFTEWRGYSIVMALLATNPISNLQEFILDTGQENIGMPYELFAPPSADYANTIQALSTAHVTKFQFSLIEQIGRPFDQDRTAGDPLETYLLKHILSAMPHLEDLDLKWNTRPEYAHSPFSDGFLQQSCPRLKYLALRIARLEVSWLYNLIVNQNSLETVVLDKIVLVSHGLSTVSPRDDLFSHLREHYISMSLRGPRFTWIERLPGYVGTSVAYNRMQWAVLDEELDAYLYDGTVSPWLWETFLNRDSTPESIPGWIMHGRDPYYRKRRNEVLSGTGIGSRGT